nr:hypothetical protein [Gammaproteobacteria bacterium]
MQGREFLRSSLSLFWLLALASVASAETYYVRNGGNDNADGRSHETAWATIGKVNGRALKPGDQVLFHAGDVFKDDVLTIASSGTRSERIVIGAYHVENGEAKRGLRDDVRPVLDGENKRPASMYGALIRVTGDYVRVEDLEIVNSGGRGVVFERADFGEAVNLRIDRMYNSAIRFIGSNDGLAEGNYITHTGLGWYLDGARWGATIVAQDRSARTVIRNNVILRVFGEGINAHHGATDTLIEGNFVFSARALGIYSDAAPGTIIRRNIVLGTTDPDYWRGGSSTGGGIILNNEGYHYEGGNALPANVQSKNVQIYGNLVASTAHGIGFWGQFSGTSFDNILIYNNTLVDNDVQFFTRNKPMPGSVFVNNILYSESPGTKDVEGPAKGLTARNNYFSQGDPGEPFSHSGNVYEGLELSRMSGWRSITEGNEVSWRDFEPTKASATNGAGVKADLIPAALKEHVLSDFNGKPHNDPMDLGALRARTGSGKVPKSPKAFTATAR